MRTQPDPVGVPYEGDFEENPAHGMADSDAETVVAEAEQDYIPYSEFHGGECLDGDGGFEAFHPFALEPPPFALEPPPFALEPPPFALEDGGFEAPPPFARKQPLIQNSGGHDCISMINFSPNGHPGIAELRPNHLSLDVESGDDNDTDQEVAAVFEALDIDPQPLFFTGPQLDFGTIHDGAEGYEVFLQDYG